MATIKDWFRTFLDGQVKDSDGNLIGTVIGKQSLEVYYKELAIQLCINLIANSLSECTFRTYENNEEKFGIEYYILNVRPNVNENSSMLWHKAVERMIYDGEALIVNVKGSLYVADAYGVEEYPIKGNIYTNVTINSLALNKKFKQDDVILLRLNNVNVKKLIDSLYRSYGELLEYCIERYKLDNQEKYVLELDNVKVGDKQFNDRFKDILQEQLQDFLDNQKTVLPLYKGQTLTDVSKGMVNTSKSTDLANLIENLFKMVAQAFNIPLDLLFGKTDNISMCTTQFLTFCINPIACMIEEELSAKLYDGFEGFTNGNYCKVDTSDIRHINILDVANAIDKILASGVLSINELRDLIGYNELQEDYASQHWMTKNYDLASNMLNGQNFIEPPKEEEERLEGGDTDEE